MAISNDNTTGINVDTMLLRQYLQGEKISDIEANEITKFNVICPGYLNTNEKLDLYYAKNLESKRVLSVTSSGDHILHAVLGGCKDITGFDINRVAKYFSALKIAMVRTYDRDEFIKKISFVYDYLGYKCLYSFDLKDLTIFSDTLEDVSNSLTEKQIIFWQELVDWINKNRHCAASSLFYSCSYFALERYNAWVSCDNYLKLKENLEDCSITYVDSNVNSLLNKVEGKFDIIYLSNILGRMGDFGTGREVDLLIYLRKMLNKDGVIYDYDWYAHPFIRKPKLKLFYNVEIESLDDDIAFIHKYSKKRKS